MSAGDTRCHRFRFLGRDGARSCGTRCRTRRRLWRSCARVDALAKHDGQCNQQTPKATKSHGGMVTGPFRGDKGRGAFRCFRLKAGSVVGGSLGATANDSRARIASACAKRWRAQPPGRAAEKMTAETGSIRTGSRGRHLKHAQGHENRCAFEHTPTLRGRPHVVRHSRCNLAMR